MESKDKVYNWLINNGFSKDKIGEWLYLECKANGKTNKYNAKKHAGIDYEFVEYSDIEDDDIADIKEYNGHVLKGYYYDKKRDKVYLNTGRNYRVLHVDVRKRVCVRDENNKKLNMFTGKLKRSYGLQ